MNGLLDRCCVVLVRTQGPVNLGMVSRACGNLGVNDLRLVAPECEVNCPDTRKFSTHSRELILNAPVHADVAAAVADCDLVIGSSARPRDGEYGPSQSLASLPGLIAARAARKIALVFGNEADGLSDAELIHCQAWLHLDTFGPNTSYNLSHAVAISLYVLGTHAAVAPTDTEPPAPRHQIEMLYQYWLGSLERFQYFRRTERERFAPQLRRLFNRLDLGEHDVQVLWGMLSQFNVFTFGDRGELPGTVATEAAAGSPAVDGLAKQPGDKS
jgi:tRNA (cytidine32/uridine32-2'-O)-methyltransferase